MDISIYDYITKNAFHLFFVTDKVDNYTKILNNSINFTDFFTDFTWDSRSIRPLDMHQSGIPPINPNQNKYTILDSKITISIPKTNG